MLYQLASRFNHSCRANAAYHFKPGGTVVVRTLVDIGADQEICISYLDPLQPYPMYAIHSPKPEVTSPVFEVALQLTKDQYFPYHTRAPAASLLMLSLARALPAQSQRCLSCTAL